MSQPLSTTLRRTLDEEALLPFKRAAPEPLEGVGDELGPDPVRGRDRELVSRDTEPGVAKGVAASVERSRWACRRVVAIRSLSRWTLVVAGTSLALAWTTSRISREETPRDATRASS